MRRPVLLALGAGALLSLGLPPFGWWGLALVGAGLLIVALGELPVRGRALVGVTAGVGFLAPGLWWMTEFTLPGWALAMLLEAGMVAVAVAAIPPGRWQAVGVPAAFVLSDAVRGVWPFGGVPIATLSDTQIGGPVLEPARIGGGLLVAALVGVTGVGLAALWRRRWARGAVLIAAVALASTAGVLAPDGRRTGSLRIATVQAGGERGTRAVDTDEDVVFRRHLVATRAVPAGVDVILWPEDVVDVDEEQVVLTPEGEALADLAAAHRATLVAGVVSGTGGFRNRAMTWGPDGVPGDTYEKNYRVPFGEYIPFRSLIDRVADISAVPHDARAGDGPGILRTEAGDLGVVVSFEVFFARRARSAMRAGGEVLLVPTNASSYSSTQMPALELGAARVRAIETGRHVAQAAPTGFSAIVDHRGRVRERSDLGRRQVLTATIHRRTGDTLYTRLGDAPFVLAALVSLLAAWWITRSRSGDRTATADSRRASSGDGSSPNSSPSIPR